MRADRRTVLAAIAATPLAGIPPAAAAAGPLPRRALIVEPEDGVCEILALYLEKGFGLDVVDTASCVSDAVSNLRPGACYGLVMHPQAPAGSPMVRMVENFSSRPAVISIRDRGEAMLASPYERAANLQMFYCLRQVGEAITRLTGWKRCSSCLTRSNLPLIRPPRVSGWISWLSGLAAGKDRWPDEAPTCRL